jgi:hypothetical protein
MFWSLAKYQAKRMKLMGPERPLPQLGFASLGITHHQLEFVFRLQYGVFCGLHCSVKGGFLLWDNSQPQRQSAQP